MAHYHIAGRAVAFVPLMQFRQQYDLPPDFGVNTFEPKDYAGLGTLDHAGAALNDVQAAVLERIPATLTTDTLMPCFDMLEQVFRQALYGINAQVQLRDDDIEFAVAGFSDVNRAALYALVRAGGKADAAPPFATIYHTWLWDSIRLSQTQHAYNHNGAAWRVKVVNNAYGRMGLCIQLADDNDPVYVLDTRLACPAEGFMKRLLENVYQRVVAAL